MGLLSDDRLGCVGRAVDWLLQTSAGQSIEQRIYSRDETLHTPHLLDLEALIPVHRPDVDA